MAAPHLAALYYCRETVKGTAAAAAAGTLIVCALVRYFDAFGTANAKIKHGETTTEEIASLSNNTL